MRWETAFGGRIACSLHLKPFACFRGKYIAITREEYQKALKEKYKANGKR